MKCLVNGVTVNANMPEIFILDITNAQIVLRSILQFRLISFLEIRFESSLAVFKTRVKTAVYRNTYNTRNCINDGVVYCPTYVLSFVRTKRTFLIFKYCHVERSVKYNDVIKITSRVGFTFVN